MKKKKSFQQNGKVNYNLLFRNCHDFTCDIEKILFPNPKIWHHFEYYLDAFFYHFFPEIDLENLKSIYKEKLKKENEDIYYSNIDEVTNELRDNQPIYRSNSFLECQENLANFAIELSLLNNSFNN